MIGRYHTVERGMGPSPALQPQSHNHRTVSHLIGRVLCLSVQIHLYLYVYVCVCACAPVLSNARINNKGDGTNGAPPVVLSSSALSVLV